MNSGGKNGIGGDCRIRAAERGPRKLGAFPCTLRAFVSRGEE